MEGGKELQVSRKQCPVVQNELSEGRIKYDNLKSLMQYFGWEHARTNHGVLLFKHKAMTKNLCYIKPILSGDIIARIDFMAANNEIAPDKQDVAKVKTWQGLFTAIRNHTKSLIYRREVLLQVGQTAA